MSEWARIQVCCLLVPVFLLVYHLSITSQEISPDNTVLTNFNGGGPVLTGELHGGAQPKDFRRYHFVSLRVHLSKGKEAQAG